MAMLDNQSVAGKFPVGHLNGRFSGKSYVITRGYCSKTVLRGWNFHPCPTYYYGIEDIQLPGVGSRSWPQIFHIFLWLCLVLYQDGLPLWMSCMLNPNIIDIYIYNTYHHQHTHMYTYIYIYIYCVSMNCVRNSSWIITCPSYIFKET